LETPREVFNLFERPGAEHLFSAILTAESGKALKPAPDMLNAAMEAMGTTPQETAFGGDSPTDIQAGEAAGVVTATIPRKGEQPIVEADIKARNFDELTVIIRSLAKPRVSYSY
jgi:FMN phosphatase YigB (HAD superfamily)